MKTRGWSRKLWGVKFSSPFSPGMLLGEAWLGVDQHQPSHRYAPTRALLFCTRAQARAYCAQQDEKYRGRDDCCATWRFQVVRVRETVRLA